jgi:hypothetical protein
MSDIATLLALAQHNPRGFALLALYLAVSGLLSFALAHKSQVDAWAEKRPRLAGALKILRGVGLDPWAIAQGLSLLFRGKLPERLKEAQAAEVASQKRQDTINPPPPPPNPPPGMGLGGGMAAAIAMLLLLLSCGGSQPDPRALIDLTPLVCRSVLAAQRLQPAEVERICADSRIGAQLGADIAEAVSKAALAAQPAVDGRAR